MIGSGRLNHLRATSRYEAPELIIDDQRELEKGDMFALGMTLYQLATGIALPEPGQRAHPLPPQPLCRCN